MDVNEPTEGVDLTPRDVAPRRTPRRLVGVVVGIAVVAGIVAVLWNGLSEATVFFYNVDQAAQRRDDIGDKRFRMQGHVVEGSEVRRDGGVDFELTFGGETVEVTHVGEPPELFGPAIPVVLEGRFEGDGFRSDRILIRHDSDYEDENEERLRDAERDLEQTAGGRAADTPG